jgi:hypothetical protein
MMGSCKCSTQYLCSRKGGEFAGEMNEYQLLNMGSPCSFLTPQTLIHHPCKTTNHHRFSCCCPAKPDSIELCVWVQRSFLFLPRFILYRRVNLATGPVSVEYWAVIRTQLPLSAGCIIPSVQIQFLCLVFNAYQKGCPICILNLENETQTDNRPSKSF